MVNNRGIDIMKKRNVSKFKKMPSNMVGKKIKK